MRVVMKCKQVFSAGGRDYMPGDEVSTEDALMWPDNAVERRLANGFVAYEGVEDEAVSSPSAFESDLKAAEDELARLSKAELATLAKSKYNLDLDPTAMNKNAMMDQVLDVIAKAHPGYVPPVA